MQKVWNWLPTAVVIIIIYGTIYACGHYILRQGANEPLVQTSEDIANDLSMGQDVADVVPQTIVNSGSLAPFVVVYNGEGEIIVGNVTIDGSAPVIPIGVLKFAEKHGQNRVTWEPQKGVRFATVTTTFKNSLDSGYVLAGRSLREVEKRIDGFLVLANLGLLVSLFASFLLSVFIFPVSVKKK